MSRFFKSAAFPILIVVVLAFFAQKLISPGTHTHVPNYSEFVTQVNSGQVKDVTIQTKDNTLDVELKSGRKYQTAYPDNTEPQMVKTLSDNQVGIDVRGKGPLETWIVTGARSRRPRPTPRPLVRTPSAENQWAPQGPSGG